MRRFLTLVVGGVVVALLLADPSLAQETGQVVDTALAQEATGDGTEPFTILAIGLFVLAALLSVLTWGYWQATTPRHPQR